ncbi:MAG: peptide-methionine (R)-S-oxide reductase MsrB [Fimbriimonadaceae bacterium]|jgi:peptide-methionine (R)-S-oxide reductase|nr:peptide-methionine (R)-S-oxide reductase MsrB [Fimbriimonadaceae bacterium]
MQKKIVKSEEQWMEELDPLEFHVLRLKGTERPFSGEYVNHKGKGTYCCRACGAELFNSATKFNSGCGWPSFFESLPNTITYTEDLSHGMRRIEVTCSACDGHLGHIFDDAPQTPSGQRYCINSVSIRFKPEPE